MRNFIITFLSAIAVLSCAPVINKDIMDMASRTFSFSEARRTPEIYRGKIFILGGIIVDSKVTEKSSIIEAIYVPVNRRGYLKDIELESNRFIAFQSDKERFLDPMIYRKGREVTIAGLFTELRTGKVDKRDYVYPVFEIKEIYLWEEREYYYGVPPYQYYYPYWWNDPWYRYYYYPRPYYWYEPYRRR